MSTKRYEGIFTDTIGRKGKNTSLDWEVLLPG